MAFRSVVIALAVVLSACAPKSELDAAQKQIGELQAQISELQSQVASAQAENTQLKAQLSKKPDLPVSVSFRKAGYGPGYVAVFNTTVKSPVSLLVTHQSAALGTAKRFELHLNPAVPKELGHLEGAVIEQGDTITLENQNYSSTIINVNVK